MSALLSTKDLAEKTGVDVNDIRIIIRLFGIKKRGEGPKPKSGSPAALYAVIDVELALLTIQKCKETFNEE